MRTTSNTDGEDDDDYYDYDEDEDDEVFQPSSNPTLKTACIHSIKRYITVISLKHIWCPGTGVLLDCIDSWSMLSF